MSGEMETLHKEMALLLKILRRVALNPSWILP